MKQEPFVRRHQASWEELGRVLARLETAHGGPEVASLPQRYRALCQQLALARHRYYASGLVEQLNGLAVRAHEQLYQRPPITLRHLGELLVQRFPRAVRAELGLCTLAALLFYGPLLLVVALIAAEPERVYLVLSPERIGEVEEMYDPQSVHHLRPREVDSDVYMFGFYIANNVGIALRTFGMGVVLGVGSMLVLVENGLHIGAVLGHLSGVGMGGTLWPFVVGHSAFELTAIVIAGAAGMKLGLALLAPGWRTRGHALRVAALEAVPLICGCGLMLVIAAFIEAFWSASGMVPAPVKYTVGALLWALVALWLGLGGRGGR